MLTGNSSLEAVIQEGKPDALIWHVGTTSALHLDLPATAQPQTQKQQGMCNAKDLQRLLVIGRASPNEAGMYGADAIRLAVVDYDRGRAAILALPVGLWVDTPVLADIGVNETSLNLAYQKAWENAHGQA